MSRYGTYDLKYGFIPDDDCPEAPKPTNSDRFRAKSDEELADFLCDISECSRRCPAKVGDCIFSDSACKIAWLNWLKQEVGA